MNDRISVLLGILLAILLLVAAEAAHAGGPRFVSNSGRTVTFYTNNPLYYTDPGDLSATVTSAQADAMVAAAAAVWNVPQTALVLAQGGKLAEHVSSANTYFNGSSVVFPADVQPSNYLAMPIAIVYDIDGSVIDTLMGQGASDPTGCRQNGVIESVDSIDYNTNILHAVIVLNGRCITSTTERPQQLLQMQYQLMRVFGRVLGLSWSQLNDSVFTGSPAPTAYLMSVWPVMHPIDVICGPYTYQCTQNPFSLRDDDISALVFLYYGQYTGAPPTGKQNSGFQALPGRGLITFPTGQGAELVNITLTRGLAGQNSYEPAPIISAISGLQFQQNGGNPVTGTEPSVLNAGGSAPVYEGINYMQWVPTGPVFANLVLQTESINPLYWGDYAVGPYQRPVITMPGPQQTKSFSVVTPAWNSFDTSMTLNGAPNSCNPGNDGSESGPAAADPSGWWSGLICGVGHASWFSTTIRAHHTWTLEATALNATGQATINALQPVIGVWNATDPTGTLPTIAAAGAAMNSLSLGMTQLHVPAATADATIRLTVADQYGAGRPDFPYKGRILYADSVTPTTLPLSGGTITITGMGFRLGNQVSVNGVLATVLSWSSTQIVAIAPAVTAVTSAPVDVLVTDASTGGTTDIPSAISYANIAPVHAVAITTTSAYLAAGAAAQWTLSLAATESGAPAAATPVLWSTTTSALTLSATSTLTNTSGIATITAQTAAVPSNSTNSISACAWTTVCTTWTVYGVDPSQFLLTLTTGAAQSIALGNTLTPLTLQITDTAGHPIQAATVNIYQTAYAWEGTCTTGSSSVARCPSAPVLTTTQTTAVSDTNGLITVTPQPAPNAPQTLAIAASTGTAAFSTTTLTIHP